MSRESDWRSIVIEADPEWPRTSQVVPEYPFSGPGPRDPKGYRAKTIDGPNTFMGKTEDRGAYASDWFTAAECLTFDTDPDTTPEFSEYDGALVIEASALTNSTNATLMRFTLRGHANGPGMIEELWVGQAADDGVNLPGTTVSIDFSSAPHRVTYHGQTRIPLPVSGTVVSDELDFKLESGKNLVLRFRSMPGHLGYVGGSSDTPTGWQGSYRYNANGILPNETSVLRVTVQSTDDGDYQNGWETDGDVDLVSKVEIFE